MADGFKLFLLVDDFLTFFCFRSPGTLDLFAVDGRHWHFDQFLYKLHNHNDRFNNNLIISIIVIISIVVIITSTSFMIASVSIFL